MFSDPIVASVFGSPVNFNRVSDDGLTSVYQNSDKSLTLTISHQPVSKKTGPPVTGRMIRLDYKVIAPDPLGAVNKYVIGSVRVVFDDPDWGISDTQMLNLFTGVSNICAISGLLGGLLQDQH
uniref:Uncharacterized protein n=1 Tax=Leviviridae sp. TaxID=2027243 RepID=A0A514D7I1_9VIRU|nr:MAG: hypothetical protein H4Rhizo451464_000002 [Leviviridae sp.]